MRKLDGSEVLHRLGFDYLKDASTLGALSDRAIDYLMSRGKVYALDVGDPMFEAGARGDSFFVILQGSFAYFRCLEGHLEHLRDYHFGEEVGFVSMVALTERKGSAIASSDSLVLEVDHELYYDMHCELPLDFGLLSMNLSREMARTILTYTEMLVVEKKSRVRVRRGLSTRQGQGTHSVSSGRRALRGRPRSH